MSDLWTHVFIWGCMAFGWLLSVPRLRISWLPPAPPLARKFAGTAYWILAGLAMEAFDCSTFFGHNIHNAMESIRPYILFAFIFGAQLMRRKPDRERI